MCHDLRPSQFDCSTDDQIKQQFCRLFVVHISAVCFAELATYWSDANVHSRSNIRKNAVSPDFAIIRQQGEGVQCDVTVMYIAFTTPSRYIEAANKFLERDHAHEKLLMNTYYSSYD